MNPAVIGIGAAVSARAIRPSPRSADVKCSQAAYAAVMAKSAKKIVLMVIPLSSGMSLLNGTP